MKKHLISVFNSISVIIAMLGIYCICESTRFNWIYGFKPVAIVTGAVTLISVIWGLFAKKSWIMVAFPVTSLVSMTLLAVVTRYL